MGFQQEFKKRFGGIWNALFLVGVAVVCLRFAGAEWASSPLGTRLLRAIWLVLGCIGLGVTFAVVRIIVARFEEAYDRPSVSESIAWGLKYGLGSGAALVFLVGVLMVKDFLTPVLDLWSKTFGKLVDKLIDKIP